MQNVSDYFNDNEGTATWILAVLALLAGLTALVQIAQARALSFEQSRPYVVVGLRRVTATAVELYAKNYGLTAAREITFESTPALTSRTFAQYFKAPTALPILAPGEEWSTIWETQSGERKGLPDADNKYKIVVKYKVPNGQNLFLRPKTKSLSETVPIDWMPYLSSSFVDLRNLNHIGKTLESIDERLKPLDRLARNPQPRPIDATVRSRWSLISEALAPRR